MRRSRAAGTVVVILALAAGGVTTSYWLTRNHATATLAGVVEIQEVHVGSKLGGRVAEVTAHEGDVVDAGTLLVRFEVPETQARRDQLAARLAQAGAAVGRLEQGARPEEIRTAAAALAAAQARVATLEAWTRPEEIRAAEAELEAARADAALAETTAQRIDDLKRQEVASAQQADDARAARDAGRARVRAAEARLALVRTGARADEIRQAREEAHRAQAQLDLLRAGARVEDLAEARARRDEAQAALAEADANLREAEVRAPARARVEVLSVRKGDLLAPGKTLARLLLPGDLWVKAFCPEPDLGLLAVGRHVQVQVDTYPDRRFDGVITSIAGESEFTPRNVQSLDERWNQVFAVKIRVDAPEDLLKPGMAAQVSFAR